MFGDLPQEQIIESQNLTRDKLIGEGGFASVYEGRLTRKTGRVNTSNRLSLQKAVGVTKLKQFSVGVTKLKQFSVGVTKLKQSTYSFLPIQKAV